MTAGGHEQPRGGFAPGLTETRRSLLVRELAYGARDPELNRLRQRVMVLELLCTPRDQVDKEAA